MVDTKDTGSSGNPDTSSTAELTLKGIKSMEDLMDEVARLMDSLLDGFKFTRKVAGVAIFLSLLTMLMCWTSVTQIKNTQDTHARAAEEELERVMAMAKSAKLTANDAVSKARENAANAEMLGRIIVVDRKLAKLDGIALEDMQEEDLQFLLHTDRQADALEEIGRRMTSGNDNNEETPRRRFLRRRE